MRRFASLYRVQLIDSKASRDMGAEEREQRKQGEDALYWSGIPRKNTLNGGQMSLSTRNRIDCVLWRVDTPKATRRAQDGRRLQTEKLDHRSSAIHQMRLPSLRMPELSQMTYSPWRGVRVSATFHLVGTT